MRLRPSLLVLPVIAVALLASGCFEARTAGTVSTPITVGVGTGETEVNPAGSTGASTSETAPATGTTSEPTSSSTESTGTATGTTTGGSEASFPASAKGTFAKTCGGCHTLADAGTKGAVGPNLDDLKPDQKTVANQIEHGGGGMPPGLLKGQDLQDVSAYVAAVAGKGGG